MVYLIKHYKHTYVDPLQKEYFRVLLYIVVNLTEYKLMLSYGIMPRLSLLHN